MGKFISFTNEGEYHHIRTFNIFGVKLKFKDKRKLLRKKLEMCMCMQDELSHEISVLRNAMGGVRSYLGYFEVHLTDHCNLNCKACEHYCPLVPEPAFCDINEFIADFRELSGKLTVGTIRLMGGEPLLHPDVNGFVAAARKYFPYSRIHIVTNGMLLPKMNGDFWRTLRENDIFLDISGYPPLRSKYDSYRRLAGENKVKLGWGNIADTFWCSLNSKGNSNIEEVHRKCPRAVQCHNLRHGRMMICPEACYMDIYNKYFNENIPVDAGIDIYGHSGAEIVKYLKSPKETCRYCVPNGRSFEWGVSAKDKTEWEV